MKDFDFELQYHPGKANVVADALSRKALHVSMMMVKEAQLIEEFRYLNLEVNFGKGYVKLGTLQITNEFMDQVREK